MTTAPEDLAAALHELPLFPLQQVVLFPGMLLPLYVFEPRYVALLRHVLTSHRSLSVVQVQESQADMSANPAIAEIAGVGTIVDCSELPHNRYNIVLRGRARVRLQELSFDPPYRRALASLLATPDDQVPGIELAAMHSAVATFTQLVRKRDPSFELRLPKDATAGAVADACAHHLVLDARDRQAVLEALEVRKRISMVTEILTVQVATLAPRDGALN
jgi:Lon protease-like protein